MSTDWMKEGDEVTVVTSDRANALMARISDDAEVMAVWLTAMSQLRPTKEPRNPVNIHPDDRIYAEELVGLGLLERSEDDVDAYLVSREIAHAEFATDAFLKELH